MQYTYNNQNIGKKVHWWGDIQNNVHARVRTRSSKNEIFPEPQSIRCVFGV